MAARRAASGSASPGPKTAVRVVAPPGPKVPFGSTAGAGSSSGGGGTGSYPHSASSAAPTARPVSMTRPSSQTSTVRAVMLRCTQP
ncbi:hypothetical protein STENM223S_09029 [Streptomyces tendae]